jgi:hypothetical protein
MSSEWKIQITFKSSIDPLSWELENIVNGLFNSSFKYSMSYFDE